MQWLNSKCTWLFVTTLVLALLISGCVSLAVPVVDSVEIGASGPMSAPQLLPAAEMRVADQPADPEAVVRAYFEAINEGDLDLAMSLVAEDAIFVRIPPPPGQDAAIGKEAERVWEEIFVSHNGWVEITDLYVHGDQVAFTANLSEELFNNIVGAVPMVANMVAIVQGGQIRSFAITFTEASQIMFDIAFARELNKEVVRGYMVAWDKGDLDTLDEIFAADFVNHSPPLPPDREGMMQAAADEHVGFPNNVWTIEQIVAEGDLVAVHLHFVGVHEGEFFGVPATGAEVDFTGTLIFRIHEGQITERWGDADMVSFLTPLGFELVPPAQ